MAGRKRTSEDVIRFRGEPVVEPEVDGRLPNYSREVEPPRGTVTRRAYAATKEAGPPRIKLRSFASSGRWSRASTRPIFDRDPGMYLSCHLLHFSFPFSTTLRIFIERILRYLILNFFFFFKSIELKTIEAIGKGEKKLPRHCPPLL